MAGEALNEGRKPGPQVEIDRGLVAVNALSSALTHLISIGVLLWVNQYLLKRLSAEEYAPFPIAVAVFLFLQVFTAVLTGGIARYITEAYAKGDLRRVTEIVSSMFPLIAVAVLGFWALGGLVAWNVGQFLKIEPEQIAKARLMLALMVFGHGAVLLAMPFSVGLHVRQKFIWLNLIKLGEQVVRLGLLCFLLFEVSTGVHWVVVSTQTALLAAAAVTFLISRRMIPELRFERGAYRPGIRRELSSFGGWMMLGSLLHRIRTSADVIILNRLGSAVDVTDFHVGRLPDRQLDSFLSVVSVTMQPALIAMHAANRRESLRRAYTRGNRYHLWFVLAIATPLFVFADELVVLYAGETYILAAAVLKFRCASYPVVYANQMLVFICVAMARIRTFFLIVSAGAAVHLAAAVVLAGQFGLGVLGVVYASFAVVLATQLALLWPLALRLLDLRFARHLRETLIPGYLPAAGALACGFAIKTEVVPDSWLSVGTGVAGCLLVYALLTAIFSTAEDRRDVAAVLRRARAKLRPVKAVRSPG